MKAAKMLGQFIIEKQTDFPYAKGELSRLLCDLGVAAKIVNREVNKAGLANIIGDAGSVNIQGEGQKKPDIYANEQFLVALQCGGECCILVSDENDDYIYIDSELSDPHRS
jgi:fructose-1,6-bisphosphatase I